MKCDKIKIKIIYWEYASNMPCSHPHYLPNVNKANTTNQQGEYSFLPLDFCG